MDSILRGCFKKAITSGLTYQEIKDGIDTGALYPTDIIKLKQLLEDFEDRCPECGYVDPAKAHTCPNCGYKFCG